MSHTYCPECGFQNPEASNYCSRCGALLSVETGSETTMTFDIEQPGDEVDLLEALGISGPALVVRSGGGRASRSSPTKEARHRPARPNAMCSSTT